MQRFSSKRMMHEQCANCCVFWMGPTFCSKWREGVMFANSNKGQIKQASLGHSASEWPALGSDGHCSAEDKPPLLSDYCCHTVGEMQSKPQLPDMLIRIKQISSRRYVWLKYLQEICTSSESLRAIYLLLALRFSS